MTLPELCGATFALAGTLAGLLVPIIAGWEWWTCLAGMPVGCVGGWIIGVAISYLLMPIVDRLARAEFESDEPDD